MYQDLEQVCNAWLVSPSFDTFLQALARAKACGVLKGKEPARWRAFGSTDARQKLMITAIKTVAFGLYQMEEARNIMKEEMR